MTYLNETDGLYYTDAEFTNLASGLVQETYYRSGTPIGYINSSDGLTYYDSAFTIPFQGSSLWELGDNTYYVSGQATTLDSNGSGVWNNKPYSNGSGTDLSNADFNGQDLSGVDFSNVTNMAGAYFTNANLTNVILPSNISGVFLAGANLTGVDFSNVTNMAGANFYGLNLTGVDFSNVTNIADAYFMEAILTGADFSNVTSTAGVNFSYSGLSGVNFSNVTNIAGADFIGANLTGVNFSNVVDATSVNFANVSDLTGATLPSNVSGYYGNTYFINGQATTLPESGNGFWNNKAYYNGSEQPTGWNGYFWYINNVETNLNNYGHSAPYDSAPYNFPYEDYLYNGLFYLVGTPYTGAYGYSYSDVRNYINGLPSAGYAPVYNISDNTAFFFDENGFPVQGWFTVAQGAPDTNGRGGTYFWNYGSGATTLDENGYGWYQGVYYITVNGNSFEQYGVNSSGTGWADFLGVYLLNGVVTSLDYNGSGFHDSKAYYNGSEQPTGWNGYFYYVNNVETTLDQDGNGTWNGQTYVHGVVQGGGGGSVNLESGLQAFYKLSDTSDSSGNNRTLTNNGNVSFASGKLGNAAVFDGSNFLQSNVQQPSTAMTVSVWAKLNNTNGPRFLIDSVTGNNWSGGGFGITTDNGSVNSYVFHGGEGGEGVALSTGSVDLTLSTDVWYHIVGTHDTSTGLGKLYINGSLNNSVQHNRNDPFGGNRTNPVAFGSNADGTYGLLDGQIDAVGIWNRALSEAEVAELYNNGTGLELPAGPAVKNGWIDGIFWINDVATTLDQNGDGTWVGKLYENGSLFSGSKYSLTFVNGVAQAEQIVTVIGSNIPVAFGLNEAEEPLVELVFASITSAGETTVEQIIPTVLPTGYTVAETVLAYSIDTTATFEGSINVDFILPSNTSQTVFDRVKGFHVKNSGAIEEMTRVSSDFSTKRITVAITSFSDFLFLDQPQTSGKLVKIQGKTKFSGKVKFGV
jgi:uncharacterized protein YjbI with pentapeptide repeats